MPILERTSYLPAAKVPVSREVQEKRDRERNRQRIKRAALKASLPKGKPGNLLTIAGVIAGMVPVVLLNGVSVLGQLGFARDHFSAYGVAGEIVFAMAVESTALSLLIAELKADLANDGSFGVKTGATLVAFGAGVLNYSHAPGTAIGITTGIASCLSPFLWRVVTRRIVRDRLAALGQVDSKAVRLGATRVLWHPLKVVEVMYHETWHRSPNLAAAITAHDRRTSERAADKAARKATASLDSELKAMEES